MALEVDRKLNKKHEENYDSAFQNTIIIQMQRFNFWSIFTLFFICSHVNDNQLSK